MLILLTVDVSHNQVEYTKGVHEVSDAVADELMKAGLAVTATVKDHKANPGKKVDLKSQRNPVFPVHE